MESPKKMQPISLQKIPKSDDELMIKPKSPDNDLSLIVGRSGRVRKAKVVFDPSDVENKRRSMPIMEATKATKRPAAAVKLIENIKVEKKSNQDEEAAEQTFASLATINKRRKTISVAAFENGCIVCFRADIKKGRFVNCIGCTKRGHFTCLRNDKLFKTTDTEKRWQCPSCKICKACEKAKPNDQLYKCVLCHNSFHLHCIEPTPKNTSRKRFTCTDCSLAPASLSATKTSSPEAAPVAAPTTAPVAQCLVKPKTSSKKSSGFAGFLHAEETRLKGAKPSSNKSANKSESTNVKNNAVHSQSDRQSTSSKSSAYDQKFNIGDMFEMDIKEEIQSDQYAAHLNAYDALDKEMQSAQEANTAIAVRTDLKSSEIVAEPPHDAASKVKPHENIPDCRQWDCDEVYTYFMGTTTPEIAQLLKDNEIDGDALLLMKRDDVLRFNLKLGIALRLYSQIVSLQYKNNNPILVWNDY